MTLIGLIYFSQIILALLNFLAKLYDWFDFSVLAQSKIRQFNMAILIN